MATYKITYAYVNKGSTKSMGKVKTAHCEVAATNKNKAEIKFYNTRPYKKTRVLIGNPTVDKIK